MPISEIYYIVCFYRNSTLVKNSGDWSLSLKRGAIYLFAKNGKALHIVMDTFDPLHEPELNFWVSVSAGERTL